MAYVCITLQGTATWWIHCHDRRATCHVAGCSHLAKSMSWSCIGCKNFIRCIENHFRHILFFVFLMQFGLWRAAAFVSSLIHLFIHVKHVDRDVTDFVSDFESDGFRHFFTNLNQTDLHNRFLTDSDLIVVLNCRKINCCAVTVWHWSLKQNVVQTSQYQSFVEICCKVKLNKIKIIFQNFFKLH